MKNKTTITIERLTRDKLAALGKKDDSFDEIITKLIAKENEN